MHRVGNLVGIDSETAVDLHFTGAVELICKLYLFGAQLRVDLNLICLIHICIGVKFFHWNTTFFIKIRLCLSIDIAYRLL